MNEQKPTVLAVDDTPANLELLAGILGRHYHVKAATSGPRALELVRSDPAPDIILLDIMMPHMDGYEVCRRLKSDPSTSSIPVVFVTARAQAIDEQRGLELGAVDYVIKPFNGDVVLARVKRHLENDRARRDVEEENRVLRQSRSALDGDLTEAAIVELLAAGEGEHVEFKSTLRWNLHADRTDPQIENSCLKTVAAFLNTDGGHLFVGVDDHGRPLGLNNDGFKREDRLLQHWTNLLTSYLGSGVVRHVRSAIHDVGGIRVLCITVLPAEAPVFFNRDNTEAFFVRVANTTQALTPSKTLAFIAERFDSWRGGSPGGAGGSPDAVQQRDLHSFADWVRELQDRHVFRTAVIYLVLGWAFTEMSTTVVATLDAPSWVERVIVLVFVGGFPVVILLAWAYDLRVHRTPDHSPRTPRRTLWLLGGAFVVAAVTVGLYTLLG